MPGLESEVDGIIVETFVNKLKQRYVFHRTTSYSIILLLTCLLLCDYRKFEGSRDLAISTVQLWKKVIGQTKWQNAR